MTLRLRMFTLVSTLVAAAVLLVTWTVSARARTAFEAIDAERRSALVVQFRQEFAREGDEVVRRLDRVAAADTVAKLAIDTSLGRPDDASSVNVAGTAASAAGLDFLEIVSPEGTIVSSAQWPARFGYRHPSTAATAGTAAFLDAVELPDGRALGLMAERHVGSSAHHLRVIGGRRVDHVFLKSLVLPDGMRAILYTALEPKTPGDRFVDRSGVVRETELAPLAARVSESGAETSATIRHSTGSEVVQGIPLKGQDGEVLGALLIGSSNGELAALVRRIRWSGIVFGGLAIGVGLILSYGLAARVTRPIEQLADVARAVADGDWQARPDVRASGEIGALASAFSTMTQQLTEQRDRLVQAERVAAWRELARRLAHELKNPLFPLRITLDNLRQARTLPAEEFAEVFNESLGTLTAGLASLNTVIARFSDFARMPAPEFARVPLNDLVLSALKLFEAQLAAPGHPPVRVTSDLDPSVGTIRADPDQISRAVQNLLLNAIDAMPQGGGLTVRTRRADGVVHLDVSDTGQGLTDEERARLFTPYYTTKQHGTGLGLAIVQSVVSDHHGRIRVESAPGRGTTFHLALPAHD